MPRTAQKPTPPKKLAAAISRAAATLTQGNTQMPPPAPPQSPTAPAQTSPATDPKLAAASNLLPTGATDGLGAGVGGLAIHNSAKGANIAGYEPRHTSKRR